MIEYYPQIRHAHIALALLSGGLFAMRGLVALAGRADWARWKPLRWLSWSIDSLLLTAALMLLATLKLNPFTSAWLGVKLLVLLGYIVLGVFTLSRQRSRLQRTAFYLAALACFGFMYSVARAHHPAGWFAAWM
jgi:uncharacterized membrane protein SirB2